VARTSITFNSTSLQDSNVISRKITHESNDHRRLNIQGIGRFGAKVVDDSFDVKKITLEGTIKDTSKANLEARIDNLNKYLLGVIDKNLDIGYSSGTRRYVATCTAFIVTREYYTINCVDFQAEFIVGKPFGKGLDTNTLEFLACTTAERDSINFTGSARPLPKIKLTVTSETNLSQIEFQNTTTGDKITIIKDFTAGDILIIDCDELSVTLNGVEIDYQGVFPQFEMGWNDFYCWFEGTAYNVDLKVIYYDLWV